MRKYLAQRVRANRGSLPFLLMAKAARKYLELWYNEGFWDFERNGEARVLAIVAEWSGPRALQVWDVGAHHGEWAMEAHRYLPSAHVRSFEIVPHIAAELRNVAAGCDWLTVENTGLSDHKGTVSVTIGLQSDTTNSISPRLGSDFFPDAGQQVESPITTGDIFLQESGVSAPDFLKIDTEGHETSVFRGCPKLLSGDAAPAIIQFEYGDTYLPSGSTLHEVFGLLERKGYAIGRVYPTYVDFKTYEYQDDHFRMGNMIAVRDVALRNMLQKSGRTG